MIVEMFNLKKMDSIRKNGDDEIVNFQEGLIMFEHIVKSTCIDNPTPIRHVRPLISLKIKFNQRYKGS